MEVEQVGALMVVLIVFFYLKNKRKKQIAKEALKKSNLKIKKPNKKTPQKLKPIENYKIITVELKSRGGKTSNAEWKRFVNQSIFKTFMNVNSHHFCFPVYDDFGESYLSNGGSIKLIYSNTHPNGTPPFTIKILIYRNDTRGWESHSVRDYITGNLGVKTADKKLFTEIKKIISIHSKVSKITPDLYNKNIELEKKRLEEEEKERQEKLKDSQAHFLTKLDKDNNGKIDIIENRNEFDLLLKKHQKVFIEKGKEFNQNYTQQFVKVDYYIKQKRSNLQLIFDCIKKVTNKKDLDEYVDILEGEIHSYNLLLINSLILIVSLIEDDQFTFYNAYEKFDKLNIYNSNWENETSHKLTTLNKGISELNSNIQGLMYEIRDMSDRIVSSIDDLSYITEESTRMLDNRLGEIDSSIKTNNLLTLINTYQTYKINKNTKSLRP